jgi:glutamate 5-kinase
VNLLRYGIQNLFKLVTRTVMQSRGEFAHSRRWVIKIGSALLTNDGQGLDIEAIDRWVSEMVRLYRDGRELVLVSSGAVAEGMCRLGWHERPHAVYELQAAAAVGQMGLIQAYESCFQKSGLHTAQILLTHEDLADRQRYLNARSTLHSLLRLGVTRLPPTRFALVTTIHLPRW